MIKTLLNKLKKEPVFFDGGMGTLLQKSGLAPGDIPESWNILHPERIYQIHQAYAASGCQILKSNTFGANRCKLKDSSYSVKELVDAGVNLAKKAAAESGACVALDIGPTGKLMKPLGNLEFEEAVQIFSEMVQAGVDAGADCILIETMNDVYEAKAAVLAAKENSDLPVFVTMTFDESGKLLTGGTIEVAAAVLEGLGADAIGMNCGLGPDTMLQLLPRLMQATNLPVIINPNAGLPKEKDGETVFDIDADSFAKTMKEIAKNGVSMLGGCCGTTPDYLKTMIPLCKKAFSPAADHAPVTAVTSGSKITYFEERPIIIGERINPTGKPKFKQALREKNYEYILREGVTQQDNGAEILDVNVGLPEIDEDELMTETVSRLQAISDLPLQLDTSDPTVMEHAMRIYNGKPLVNSVTAKMSSMNAIFPLIKKYGGVVIGLTITEDGIPETPEGRLQAAEIIVKEASKYGIGRESIIIDPLTMAISADSNAASITLKAMQLIKENLDVKVSLGVSNVSFGLPQRENITASFFNAAMTLGLNAAIMNPNAEAMMRTYRSFCAIKGFDPNCMAYISAYADVKEEDKKKAAEEYTLEQAIEKGLKSAAANAAKKLSSVSSSLDIIQNHIVPALDTVGAKFQKGTLFLPQLLMSAEAAKEAFAVIKENMKADTAAETKNNMTIVIATVKGDVHDIGKNIVKVLLDNYGFNVIDLGRDVSPKTILDTVLETNAPLVGLSALMTTTVPSMKETIALLRKEGVSCKVMVGGAVLTQEYADSIGADFYGKDAMDSVRYAVSLSDSLKK